MTDADLARARAFFEAWDLAPVQRHYPDETRIPLGNAKQNAIRAMAMAFDAEREVARTATAALIPPSDINCCPQCGSMLVVCAPCSDADRAALRTAIGLLSEFAHPQGRLAAFLDAENKRASNVRW